MSRIRGWMRALIFGRPSGRRARWRAGPPAPLAPSPVVEAPLPVAEVPFAVPEGFSAVSAADYPPGRMGVAEIGGESVVLANVGGTFFAFSEVCPHAGGPLGEGSLDGHTITCPYHGWAFDIRDGRCETGPDLPLPVYETRAIGGKICVRLPDRGPTG